MVAHVRIHPVSNTNLSFLYLTRELTVKQMHAFEGNYQTDHL